MSSKDKAVITCALTGVLTDPATFPVPVTPEQMADAARQAFDAGATIVHCHFRNQEAGLGHLPTWEPNIVQNICDAIRARVPKIMINMSTGVLGPDISGPVACLERVKPELAAMNSGSLNYLKTRKDGSWAWPPLLFDNPVDKIEAFLAAMRTNNSIPECECFDTGHVRSVRMYEHNGILQRPYHVSFVMGVASGMPTRPEWLPLLVDELAPEIDWQVIAIGREEVWPLHRRTAELGGQLRTGLEDTFYLPSGAKARSNGELVEALAKIVREVGREVATPEEARAMTGLSAR
jgi:3-keto-5-aminohexanoate cleavage enzyme